MVTDKIKELSRLRAQAAKLEAALADARPAALAALPAQYGYDSLALFIKALKSAASAKPAKKRGPKSGKKAKVAKPAKRKRARVTDEIKAAVKSALEQGRKTGAIAKEVGISPASVQALKKAFGFTKPRGAAPVEVAAPAAGPQV